MQKTSRKSKINFAFFQSYRNFFLTPTICQMQETSSTFKKREKNLQLSGFHSRSCIGEGGGGWVRKKRRREEKRRGDWGEKEGNVCCNAIITPFCSPLRTLASANSYWLIRKYNKLVQQTKLAISVSLRRVVKHFPNDDFSVRLQTQCRCLQLSAWLSRNIFYTTIIQQNIGILSSECKCYLLRRMCIKCFSQHFPILCPTSHPLSSFLQTRSFEN